eukprot:NODE_466_length_8129_cov_0.354545.p2 type:complete len:444 gc:universal NODE_466_length_8129_cov_0.354545:4878-6209(+)
MTSSLYSFARTEIVNKHQKQIGDYLLLKTIGSGSMGKVKLGIHYANKCQVAIKLLPRKQDARCIREIAVMKYCSHPNILKLHCAYVSPNWWYLITDYIDGVQVLDWVIANQKIPEDKARDVIRMLASALGYLHRHCISHRDLKIENLLIDRQGQLKLIDFGLSNFYSDKLLDTFCGSLYFAAPELLKANPYNPLIADCWSFGIIIYVICSGKVPFDDHNLAKLHAKIKSGDLKYPEHFSTSLVNLLSRIIVVDPNMRVDIEWIRMSRWLNINYTSFVDCRVPYHRGDIKPTHVDILKEIGFHDIHSSAAIQMHHLIDEYTPVNLESVIEEPSNNFFSFVKCAIITRCSIESLTDKIIKMCHAHQYLLQKETALSLKISSETAMSVEVTQQSSVPSIYSDFGAEVVLQIEILKMWKWYGLKCTRLAGDMYSYKNLIRLIKNSLI